MLKTLLLAIVALVVPACGGSPAVTTTALPTTTAVIVTTPAPATATGPVHHVGDPLPTFVVAHYFPLDAVARVSRFRSGAGHDYSDSFESCSSMKHYFSPKFDLDAAAIEIRSPLNGVVFDVRDERLANGGDQIQIQPDEAPEFLVIIFHVNTEIKPGDRLVAGALLGHHVGDFTGSDIAVFANTGDNRRQAVSLFDVMTDELFADYGPLGVTSREQMIISVADRAAAPLTCDAVGGFADPGALENWVTFP